MFEGKIGTIRDWRDGPGFERTFSVTMKTRVGLQHLDNKPCISANTCNLGPENRVATVTKHEPSVQREAFSKGKRQSMIEEGNQWPFLTTALTHRHTYSCTLVGTHTCGHVHKLPNTLQ